MSEVSGILKRAVQEHNRAQHRRHELRQMKFTLEDESEVLVSFSNGRRHRVITQEVDGRILLTSMVIGAARVQNFGEGDGFTALLPVVWQRNRETNVVNFTMDKQGRLIGRIEQLTHTVQSSELAFYIELLARECDRLEYLLCGQDIQ